MGKFSIDLKLTLGSFPMYLNERGGEEGEEKKKREGEGGGREKEQETEEEEGRERTDF